MGYLNPLLKLPAMQQLMALPPSPEKALLEQLCREIRAEANKLAEMSWRRRKGPMALYWRVLSTYARHTAHALRKSKGSVAAAPTGARQTSVEPPEREGGAPGVPAEVLAAVERMCRPLDVSRLSGATAAEDARCMRLIRAYVHAAEPDHVGLRRTPPASSAPEARSDLATAG